MEDDPRKAIEHAVRGMLPKNKLEDRMMVRLKVFDGEEHPYGGQVKVPALEPASVAKEA
jgi:large subunit ribosomal protein L13